MRLSRKLRWTIGYALSVVRLSFAFSISPLKPVNGIQRHLTGSKISCPLRSLYFLGRSEKTKWPPCPLIGWDIFDFSSETVEQNSTKLYRKQHLNVLYQICFFFRTDRKNKMAALASDLLRHFRLLLWNRWTESNEIDRKMISISSTNFVFIWPIGKTRLSPWPLIGWDIFDFSSETAERNSTKPKRKQDLNLLYQVYGFFSGRLEKQDGRPGLWLAKNIWLLLWNRWREFNENWQDLGILFQVCIFRVGWKTRWPPWPLIGWDIFFSSEITEGHSTKLDRKQDLDVFYQVCVFRADRTPPPAWSLIGWDIFDISS